VATVLECPSIERERSNLLVHRCIGLSALLLAEVLLLTIRFDTIHLAHRDGWWLRLIEQLHFVPQLAAVTLTATWIFGGAELRAKLVEFASAAHPHPWWWSWCIVHIALFGLFFATTTAFFEQAAPVISTAIWSILWLALALMLFASWCGAILPLGEWLTLIQRHLWVVIGSATVGGLAWTVGQFSDWLWRPLGYSTLWFVAVLLRLIRTDVVTTSGSMIIGTEHFVVGIAPECSGYEGLGLAWVFIGTYLCWSRRELRWPHAWLLLPIATILMWLSNGLRIGGLILIGSWGFQEVALGGFHSQAGWLAFNAVVLGVLLVSQRSRFFTLRKASLSPVAAISPSAAYLMPLLALIGTLMISDAFSVNFDWLYPLRIVTVACVVGYCAKHYKGLNWNWSWTAVSIGVAAFLVWMVLEPRQVDGSKDVLALGLASLPPAWAAAWLVFRVIGSVLTVPFAEELAFRGYLIRRLQNADFTAVPQARFSWFSFLASSALFGALHPGRWLAGTLAGLLFGFALYRRGYVVDAMLAHATTNALIAVYVLTTGAWHLW